MKHFTTREHNERFWDFNSQHKKQADYFIERYWLDKPEKKHIIEKWINAEYLGLIPLKEFDSFYHMNRGEKIRCLADNVCYIKRAIYDKLWAKEVIFESWNEMIKAKKKYFKI